MLDQSYLDLLETLPPLPVRWVVSVSSGASSAVAAERTMNRYGKDNVDFVFADTQHEHPDNYRFLNDLEKRWGKQIIRLKDGRTPEQVWDDKQIIPNDQIAPCSFELKLKLIIEYVKGLRTQGYCVVMCIGYSHKDTKNNNGQKERREKYPEWMQKRYPGRLLATATNWAQSGLAYVEFPCMWTPIDVDVLQTIKAWGIPINTQYNTPEHTNILPIMYQLGFNNANCNGDCPKGGIKHWIRVYHQFPEIFKHRAEWERNKRKDPRFADYTILTHQINRKTVKITLDELAAEIEAKKPHEQKLFELQIDIENDCTTGECGVGWESKVA